MAESECQRVRSKTVGYHLGQTRGHGDGETRGMISNHRVTASPRHRVNLNQQPTGFDHTRATLLSQLVRLSCGGGLALAPKVRRVVFLWLGC